MHSFGSAAECLLGQDFVNFCVHQETEGAHYLIDFAIWTTSIILTKIIIQSEKMLIIATRKNGIGSMDLLTSLPHLVLKSNFLTDYGEKIIMLSYHTKLCSQTHHGIHTQQTFAASEENNDT